MLQTLKNHLINIPGWRTNRKIVVFESDDWGSIRMPGRNAYKRAKQKGLVINSNPYCRYDRLADQNDLHALYDVLRQFRDQHGNHPVLTANTIVANPDFDTINEQHFVEYHYVRFTDTLKTYYPNQNVFNLWQEGMNEGLFYPQFHGREHLNVSHWLEALKNEHKYLRSAFDLGFWGIPMQLYSDFVPVNLQAAHDAKSKDEIKDHKESLYNGLNMFKEIFGYKSQSFIPGNFIFDKYKLSGVLKSCGISVLQGMKYHKQPYYECSRHPLERRYPGVKNGFSEIIRNVTFEPSQEKSKKSVNTQCLKQISTAFFWNKPAVVTSHRLNFIGSIEERNRTENLELLKDLLKQILERWPDVEFLNSVQLGYLIADSDS